MKLPAVIVFACILLGVALAGCTTLPSGPTTPTATPTPVSTTIITTATIATPVVTTPVTILTTPETPPTTSVPAPIAQFSASPTSGVNPLTVHFTDLSSLSPTRWTWDFGDGSTSSEQNPVHTYADAGSYTVSLVVSNSGGSDSETKYYYITVNPAYRPPGASFTANPPTAAQPYTVQFIDRSTGPPTNWSWQFGDGGTSDLQNPVHTYPNTPATWYVTLNVSNPAGSSETTGTVTFGPQPGM